MVLNEVVLQVALMHSRALKTVHVMHCTTGIHLRHQIFILVCSLPKRKLTYGHNTEYLFSKTFGQRSFSYKGPSTWNQLVS